MTKKGFGLFPKKVLILNLEVLKDKFIQQRYRDVLLTVLKLLLTSSSKI